MMLPPSAQLPSRSETVSQTTELSGLFRNGGDQPARVLSVRQDPLSPTLFRIQLEVGRHQVEVMTNRPLLEGMNVLLGQNSRGELQIRLLQPQSRSETAGAATTQNNSSGTTLLGLIAPQSRDTAARLLTGERLLALVSDRSPGSAVGEAATSLRPTLAASIASPSPQPPLSNQGTASSGATGSAAPEQGRASQGTASLGTASLGTASLGTARAEPAGTAAGITQPVSTAGQPATRQLQPSAAQPPLPSTSAQPGTGPQTSGPADTTSRPAAASQVGSASRSLLQDAAPLSRTAANLNQVIQGLQLSPRAQIPLQPIEFNVGTERIQILSPKPLLPGQPVELLARGNDQIEIRIRPLPVITNPGVAVSEEIQQQLRTALPLQLPLAETLQQLGGTSAARSQDAVGQLVRSLFSLFSVQPQSHKESQSRQIEQLVRQSGVFTEANLAGKLLNPNRSADDLRTRLGQIRKLTAHLPEAAREQLHALLQRAEARATTQQMQSLQQWQDYPDGSSERVYRFDLPIHTPKGFDNVELLLKERSSSQTEPRKVIEWSLNLHFAFDDLGTIDARLLLQDEWQLTAKFWAEKRTTTELIRERLDQLNSDLEAQGFAVESLLVQRGSPPADEGKPLTKNLVDLKI